MSRVKDRHAQGLGIHKLVVLQVGGHKSVAAVLRRRPQKFSAGAAAHRHLMDGLSPVREPDAVGADGRLDPLQESGQIHLTRQLAHSGDVLSPGQLLHMLQSQPRRQRVVDAALGPVQVCVHTNGGNTVLNKLEEQPPLGRVVPNVLHRAPRAVHHRMMGHDQIRAPLRGLFRHAFRNVQSHQDPADLPVRPADKEAHIVPLHSHFPGSQSAESPFDLTYRWHVPTPLSILPAGR